MKAQVFLHVLRRRIVLTGTALIAFTPIQAHAVTWECCSSGGYRWTFNFDSSCISHFTNDCMSDGSESTSCMGKSTMKSDPTCKSSQASGAIGGATSGSYSLKGPAVKTPTPNNSLKTAATEKTSGTIAENTQNNILAKGYEKTAASNAGRNFEQPNSTANMGPSPSTSGIGSSRGVTETPAPPLTGGPDPEVFTASVDPRPESAPEPTVDLGAQAAEENKIAIGEAGKLQDTLAEKNAQQNEAVAFYRAPGNKNPEMAAQFFGKYSGSSADDSSISGLGGGDTLAAGLSSDVSSSKKLSLDKTALAEAANESGKAAAGSKSRSSNVSEADTETLIATKLKGSMSDKIAKLIKDASLRDSLKEYLEDYADGADPETTALAEALDQAEAAAATMGSVPIPGRSLASNGNGARGIVLNDGESTEEVNRLLGIFGGDTRSAAPEISSEPLFARVHSAHLRSLERGALLSKQRLSHK